MLITFTQLVLSSTKVAFETSPSNQNGFTEHVIYGQERKEPGWLVDPKLRVSIHKGARNLRRQSQLHADIPKTLHDLEPMAIYTWSMDICRGSTHQVNMALKMRGLESRRRSGGRRGNKGDKRLQYRRKKRLRWLPRLDYRVYSFHDPNPR
jgi:hypothetical protein